MKFGMWNEGTLYRASSIMALAEELRNYKFDLVEAQEVRCNMSGTESPGKYTFFYGLVQGWAIVLARGPLCGSGGWRRAAPFKIIAFIS
jgi:hypothetical protein